MQFIIYPLAITFFEVEQCASELGVSRSEFYATADLLGRIEPDDSSEVAVVLGHSTRGAGGDSSIPRNLCQNQTFVVLF
ncbi:MAG: hypothetical protein F2881_03770 [Actinobacteria bacterium]|uniref:Unannotated protein n=1 Tax=freshwater metagenome TaxID=449393 RepID=A0A6J7PJE6_9ZZZZ|nr:hypothetical protein [Actinomycetota bacterium]